jgi:hypothetical protein
MFSRYAFQNPHVLKLSLWWRSTENFDFYLKGLRKSEEFESGYPVPWPKFGRSDSRIQTQIFTITEVCSVLNYFVRLYSLGFVEYFLQKKHYCDRAKTQLQIDK